EGDALAGLRLRLDLAGQPWLEGAGEEAGGHDREARFECRRRLVAGKRDALGRDQRPRVETGIHPHETDAGLRVAGEDRGRDRGRATMTRQEGRVEVQRAVRQLEELGG